MELNKVIGLLVGILLIFIIAFILICCLGCHKVIKVYPESRPKNKFIISV